MAAQQPSAAGPDAGSTAVGTTAPEPEPDRWELLTRQEVRIAREIALGSTNREAAERLFLSPHTVSTHLRHIFGKLGINSRGQLSRIVEAHDEPA
ncbi:response regulator transcription factor [Wenjunlia tyrosinilytica]|uniref:HTH luxR-type domain-containing protein n=1 Tax=Wenjunlia tyrosinilytica TaxID=1544741 RepID=A0A917ZUB8_9ACTN|nr:helix-turn-helix transcriptional regulator [Wenjunlia tyrosinilytica]GGO90557.1 hypothetical protein GCM10012280_36350 [Wenjunlia tyrosinilytica]